MARLVILATFFLFAFASWGGAVDTVVPGAGRQAGAVPMAIPYNFSAGLQLQRGPSSLPSINTTVGQTPGLPSMAQLSEMGASWLGLRANNQTPIPALPQSLVITGEMSNTALVPTGAAFLTPAVESGAGLDVVRKAPPSPDTREPGMQRVSQELSQKTAALQQPLETAAKTGANAPSFEGLARAGDEIWDVLSAVSRDEGGSSKGSPVLAGDLRGGAAGSSLESRSEEGGGSKGSPDFGAVSVPEVTAAGVENNGDSHLSWKTSILPEAAETAAQGQAAFAPRAVALITMDVVGQSLVLSDAGALAAARRAAAQVAASALDESGADLFGRRDAVSSRESSGLAMAETLGARAVSLLSSVPSDGVFEQNAAGPDFTGLKPGRARASFLSRVFEGSGLWSLAVLLPLLLLALAALPEHLA